MAVSSNLTSLEDFETSPTYLNIGSGPGATDDGNAPIEGVQSGGRRLDNQTAKGFMALFSPSVDLSAAGEHVKMWLNTFQWNAVTSLRARIHSGTDVHDNHNYPDADIPLTMGYFPLWVDVSRTPDSEGDSGGANEAAITHIGFFHTIANIGGAGNNCLMDEIHHGTSGLTWSGSEGSFGDFRTYENTNVEGVFVPYFGADLCFARLELSDSAATSFTDSGFTITFPDQVLVASTFMGISVVLGNASTVISLSDGALISGNPASATRRPDFLVTGTTAGAALTMDTMLFNGFRTIELNGLCSLTNSTILSTGLVDATASGSTGADLSGTTIALSTVAVDASSLLWDVNADPNGELDDMTFDRGANAHHAIEFGSSSPLTMTLTNPTSIGFNASDAQNDSFFLFADRGSDVTWTVNVIGGTGNFSFKKVRAGDTVNIVQAVTVTFTGMKDNTEVRVFAAGTTTELAGIENATAGSPDDRSFAWSQPATTSVDYVIHNVTYEHIRVEAFSVPATPSSIPIQQSFDRNFKNPLG